MSHLFDLFEAMHIAWLNAASRTDRQRIMRAYSQANRTANRLWYTLTEKPC